MARADERASDDDGAVDVRIASLHVYPVKSCAGIDVASAELSETGFDLDRTWMAVDAGAEFVTQRELPRLALVRTALKNDELVLRAPGMLALHIGVDRVEAETTADVWNDRIRAFDMGPLAAQWFSDFVGRPLRLVRFDPEAPRHAERRWTRGVDAPYALQDAFPLLVVSRAALDALNERLAARGDAPVSLARFRPNVVVDGLAANDEDHVDEIAFATADGPVVLRLVKPCVRCTIPDVDPATGVPGHAVGDALATYRADPRVEGRITFGMNAIVADGIGRTLRVGDRGRARYAFD